VYRRLERQDIHRTDDVKDCLLAALTRNQVDERMSRDWFEMVEEGKHEFLPGNEYAGFAGLKWMPPRPNLTAIGRGLKLIEPQIYGRVDGRGYPVEEFAQLLKDVRDTFPQRKRLAQELLLEAHQNDSSWCMVYAWVHVFAGEDAQREQLLRDPGPAKLDVMRSVLASARDFERREERPA